MEKMLQKLARQLNGMDEASLMSLWSKYATLASRFEPTGRWEEACLIFSMIQGVRFKNQLFNCCWKAERQPPFLDRPEPAPPGGNAGFSIEPPPKRQPKPCRVLSFQSSLQTQHKEEGE